MNSQNRGWDGLLDFPRALFRDTYFTPGEDYEGWLARITTTFQNDEAHGLRMASYIRDYWFIPSTPVSSNGGTDRGLPVACYTGSLGDTKEHIFDGWRDSAELGSLGGGEGRDWSQVREIFAQVGKFGGTSSGIIPFLGVDGQLSNAISQGGIRRFSSASYLYIGHPEIEEFIDIRKPTGDISRRAPDLHHGVVIPDAFMWAVLQDSSWDLISPKTGEVVKTVQARKLWEQLLDVRVTLKGEPYFLFVDTVNGANPEEYIKDGLVVTTSQLCNEIMLATDKDRGNICVLGSTNAEFFDEWQHDSLFIGDCLDFLDNVLQDFLDRTEGNNHLERFRTGAEDERAIGLGVLGFHTMLQKHSIPFESSLAQGMNKKLFKHMYDANEAHQLKINKPCPLSIRTGSHRRNPHWSAVAPTMSISTLANVASSGIEPILSNRYTKKVQQGSFIVTNKYLDDVLRQAAVNRACTDDYTNRQAEEWYEAQWTSIKKNKGSVQHLEWLPDWDKDVFKTAFELDQTWLIEHASDRQPWVSQGQSLNIFIPGGSHVQLISDIHILAWVKKVKGMYYLRSTAVTMASTDTVERKTIGVSVEDMMEDTCKGCS